MAKKIRRPDPTKATDAARVELETLLTEFLEEQGKKIAGQVVKLVEKR